MLAEGILLAFDKVYLTSMTAVLTFIRYTSYIAHLECLGKVFRHCKSVTHCWCCNESTLGMLMTSSPGCWGKFVGREHPKGAEPSSNEARNNDRDDPATKDLQALKKC